MSNRAFSNSIDDLGLGDLAGAQLDQLSLSTTLYGHDIRLTTSVSQSSDGKVGSWHVRLNGGAQGSMPWCPIPEAIRDAKKWAAEQLGIPLPGEVSGADVPPLDAPADA